MSDTTNNTANVPAKDLPKVEAAAKPEPLNKKSPGDVLVVVESDYVEHGGVGYKNGDTFWMPSDAAQYHIAANGSLKRIQ